MAPRVLWLAAQSSERLASSGVPSFVSTDVVGFWASKLSCFVATARYIDNAAILALQQQESFSSRYKLVHTHFGGLIVGLAIVDIVRVHKGYADRLDEEERSLLALLCADEAARIGSCFLQIQAVAALTEPVYPIISGTKNYANSASFVMTNSSVGKCLDSGTHDGRTARQVVAGWQAMLEYRACDFDSLSDCGPCVAIVQPALVAVVAAHAGLRRLHLRRATRFSPHAYTQNFFAAIREESRRVAAANDGAEADSFDIVANEAMNRSMFLQIADSLRGLLEDKMQMGNDGDDAALLQERVELRLQILWLQSMHQSTSPDAFLEQRFKKAKGFLGTAVEPLQSHASYKPAFLLECIILSFGLRSSADIAKVSSASLKLYPQIWHKTIVQGLEELPTPSASTLSRARLTVDVGFMLYMRLQHGKLLEACEQGAALYFKLDSTPLAGKNWEVVEYEVVAAESRSRAAMLARMLARRGDTLQQQGMDMPSADVAEQAALALELRLLVAHHVLPLASLGPRQSSVEHIAHSVVYRLHHECCDWRQVAGILSNIFSLTVDQGTESKICDILELPVNDYFPWWSQLFADRGCAGDDDDGDVVAQQAPATLQSLSFTSALRIPPHFHIVDKATQRFLDALPRTWPRMKIGFTSALAFFHARHNRRLFMQRCVPEIQQFLFTSGPPAWEGGRVWGVLQAAVDWLLSREVLLKSRIHLLQRDGRAPLAQASVEAGDHDAGDGPRAKRDFFDDRDGKIMSATIAAIQDKFWWAGLHLLKCFCEVIDHLQGWLLSCPCHSASLKATFKELQEFDALRAAETCIMRGRRGACLATGQHHKIMRALIADQKQILLYSHFVSLKAEDQRDLLLDFSAGQARLAAEVDIRLSVWDSLPLKLLGLSYHNVDVARDCMLKCLTQYAHMSGSPDMDALGAHALTTRLLGRDGPLRGQLVQWVQGSPMEAFPELQEVADRMAFIPTCEVSIERLHAFLKQRVVLTHNTSAAYCSLQLRRSEVLVAHEKDPKLLAECCVLASSPVKVVHALGLQHHPALLLAGRPGDDDDADEGVELAHHKWTASLVNEVVYRCDLHAPYQSLGKALRCPDPPPIGDAENTGRSGSCTLAEYTKNKVCDRSSNGLVLHF